MEDSVTDTVNKCIFCSKLSDGFSIILKCLHIACINCFKARKTDSSVLCLCLEITNEEFVDYPIISPLISSIKICYNNNCSNEVNAICSLCKNTYCKPCSEEHICSNKNQSVDTMHFYPKKNDMACCPSCKKKCVEVYCTKCSVMICSLCHLSSHRKHKFEILENFGNVIKLSLSTQKLSLEKSNTYLKYCLDKTEKQIKNLELKKISVYENIDRDMEILFNEIKKRSIELKNSVDINVSEIVSAVNENKNVFEDNLRKNKYYIDVIESTLNHGKPYDLIHLSKIIMDKTDSAKNNASSVSKRVSGIKIDLDFDDKNIEKCVSSIKEVGDIVPCRVLNVSDGADTYESLMSKVQLSEKNVDDENSDLDSLTSDESCEFLVECNACNQWAETLKQCVSCNNCYHDNCHIPLLQDNNNSENWTCFLCEDITKYSTWFNDFWVTHDTPIMLHGQKVMERILLEIFCKNEESEHFREYPAKTDYPLYHQKVTNPISLNDVKTRLVVDNSYTKLLDVIKDLKQVFSNAMQYYSQFDPYYISAYSLQMYLNKMLAKWLPKINFQQPK